jgi:hypothetical protein
MRLPVDRRLATLLTLLALLSIFLLFQQILLPRLAGGT